MDNQSKSPIKTTPRLYHVDRLAPVLARMGQGSPDDQLTTKQVCAWLGCGPQALKGNRDLGPEHADFIPYTRQSRSRITYRRGDVKAWLEARTVRRKS